MDTGSDVDAEGNSIATQRIANNAKASAIGAVIQKEFVEPGASAQTIDKRPVFRRLLAYLAEHPEIDCVIIYMRSRAFRNLGDAVLTKRQLEKMGVKLVSAKEDFGEGIMADAMEAVTDIINEVQVRMSGEDIKVKMQHKAERGGTPGRAKLGYKNVRIDHEGRQVNSIVLDDERAPLVKRAFELFATGDYTVERLLDTITDLGLTIRATRRFASGPLSRSQLHRLLKDPYYKGVVTYKGELYPGRHDAIVDADLWDAAQRVMEHRSKHGQRDRVHYHYLKGMLFCDRCARRGVESRMIFVQAKGRSGQFYYYFACRSRLQGPCTLPYLPAEDVEWHVADHYVTLGLPTDFRDLIAEAVEQTIHAEQTSVRELHDGYRKQLAKLAVREEKLLDLAEDDALPREKIRTRLRQIQIERAAAQQGLTETGDKLRVGAEVLSGHLRLLEDPHGTYATAPDATRRDLNIASFSKLWIDEDGIARDQKTPIVHELHEAAVAYGDTRASGALVTVQDLVGETENVPDETVRDVDRDPETFLLEDLFRAGSNKNVLVPGAGLEPARPFEQSILSAPCLPFHHPGSGPPRKCMTGPPPVTNRPSTTGIPQPLVGLGHPREERHVSNPECNGDSS